MQVNLKENAGLATGSAMELTLQKPYWNGGAEAVRRFIKKNEHFQTFTCKAEIYVPQYSAFINKLI